MCPRVVSRSVSVLVATGGMRLCSVNAHGHGENEPSDLWSSCISSLLRDPATSYQGRFYSANEARTYPGCVQEPRVPFAIAATGPLGMRLAATHGQAWVT